MGTGKWANRSLMENNRNVRATWESNQQISLKLLPKIHSSEKKEKKYYSSGSLGYMIPFFFIH